MRGNFSQFTNLNLISIKCSLYDGENCREKNFQNELINRQQSKLGNAAKAEIVRNKHLRTIYERRLEQWPPLALSKVKNPMVEKILRSLMYGTPLRMSKEFLARFGNISAKVPTPNSWLLEGFLAGELLGLRNIMTFMFYSVCFTLQVDRVCGDESWQDSGHRTWRKFDPHANCRSQGLYRCQLVESEQGFRGCV